jgi:hypothetical protein
MKRIREKLKTQPDRNLFHWTINGLEIRAFADKASTARKTLSAEFSSTTPNRRDFYI